MSTNDVLTLNAKIEQTRKERALDLNEAEFFEFFAAEQVLKDFEPSDEEVQDGLVGGERDGGLDALYFLVNGQFTADGTDIDPKTATRTDLILVQATRENSFSENRVEKLNLLTDDLLNLSIGEGQLSGTYNAPLRSAIAGFKDKYKALIQVSHTMTISYYLISKGNTNTVNAALRKQAERVEKKAHDLFSSATVSFRFIGAAELLELVNTYPTKSRPITLAESPIWPSGHDALVCLVSLPDYYRFIVDERGEIRNQFFESNVRDWQGKIKVNEEIRQTLEGQYSKEDFWWLNNGITILASGTKITGGRILVIESPQIVNGLQTSRAIFNYMRSQKNPNDEHRNVLVRVIATEEPESLDHVIKATNSQTEVPEFSLHMTEKIHRDIEAVLRNYDLFYERRKNHYKNEGRPIAKIVTPLNLAQTIMAVVLQRPNDARARPTSVLAKEHDQIFSTKYPITIYADCAQLMKRVDGFLRSSRVAPNDRTNLRWYLAMHYSCTLTGKASPTIPDLAGMKMPSNDNGMKKSYSTIEVAYRRLGGVDPGGVDKVAKGSDLLKEIKASLQTP